MIEKTNKRLSLRNQCELLDLNRSSLYYKAQSIENDNILSNEIHSIWLEMPFYGYRRITAELKRRNYAVNGKRILRIMQDMKLMALYPRPKTSIKNKSHKIYPYLLSDLNIIRPNQVWATDITYLKLPSGFVYLVAIIDVYSRFIVSWRISNTMDTHFCLEMLENALLFGSPDILNTDQGSQFTSESWINAVKAADIKVSMDGKGRWADNITIERFWRTLKHEHFLLHSFTNLPQLRQSIGAFIEVYNHKRLHQSLGYKTPAEVYGTKKEVSYALKNNILLPDGYVDNLNSTTDNLKLPTYPQAQQQLQQGFINLGF